MVAIQAKAYRSSRGSPKESKKLVPELRNMTYNQRMEKLGLTSLEDRRVRGDMIETYRIMTGKEDISRDKFFRLATVRGDINVVRSLKLS